jgi:hypothetical protein
MRLLVTIPHFVSQVPGPDGYYGSEREPHQWRAASVARCIAAIHQTFGPNQRLYDKRALRCNVRTAMHVDVALVTAPHSHLAAQLPAALFKHHPVDTDPRHLGFACQNLMRQLADQYEWFAYLEDDIEVTDPLFFDKLTWFIDRFGPSALLQPNRFEVVEGRVAAKLYVDGTLKHAATTGRFQDISIRPHLQADVIGPLETAATLMVMRSFDVYKPAPDNAAFLEVRHLGRRFLYDDGSVKVDPTAPE